jgi:15-cis-phytoene synthase
MASASEITRKAQSNLAFALKILPPARREDMVVFYAFCRTMDDLADDPGHTHEKRLGALNEWENGLIKGFPAPNDFQREVISLRDRAALPNDLLVAIIEGCRMDLRPQRFQTWDDLSTYCWKVACAVGLISIRLFGCKNEASRDYAVALGHALQLTNILRDIQEDLANGRRIYLPMEDLAKFDYTENDLISQVYDERFTALMEFEAQRAEAYFREAERVLPSADRAALLPARIMGEIYHRLLQKMRKDRFQVFQKRYQVSKARKLAIMTKHLIAGSV